MDIDFWITVIIGALAGGIAGPILLTFLKKRGWIHTDPPTDNDSDNKESTS